MPSQLRDFDYVQWQDYPTRNTRNLINSACLFPAIRLSRNKNKRLVHAAEELSLASGQKGNEWLASRTKDRPRRTRLNVIDDRSVVHGRQPILSHQRCSKPFLCNSIT